MPPKSGNAFAQKRELERREAIQRAQRDERSDHKQEKSRVDMDGYCGHGKFEVTENVIDAPGTPMTTISSMLLPDPLPVPVTGHAQVADSSNTSDPSPIQQQISCFKQFTSKWTKKGEKQYGLAEGSEVGTFKSVGKEASELSTNGDFTPGFQPKQSHLSRMTTQTWETRQSNYTYSNQNEAIILGDTSMSPTRTGTYATAGNPKMVNHSSFMSMKGSIFDCSSPCGNQSGTRNLSPIGIVSSMPQSESGLTTSTCSTLPECGLSSNHQSSSSHANEPRLSCQDTNPEFQGQTTVLNVCPTSGSGTRQALNPRPGKRVSSSQTLSPTAAVFKPLGQHGPGASYATTNVVERNCANSASPITECTTRGGPPPIPPHPDYQCTRISWQDLVQLVATIEYQIEKVHRQIRSAVHNAQDQVVNQTLGRLNALEVEESGLEDAIGSVSIQLGTLNAIETGQRGARPTADTIPSPLVTSKERTEALDRKTEDLDRKVDLLLKTAGDLERKANDWCRRMSELEGKMTDLAQLAKDIIHTQNIISRTMNSNTVAISRKLDQLLSAQGIMNANVVRDAMLDPAALIPPQAPTVAAPGRCSPVKKTTRKATPTVQPTTPPPVMASTLRTTPPHVPQIPGVSSTMGTAIRKGSKINTAGAAKGSRYGGQEGFERGTQQMTPAATKRGQHQAQQYQRSREHLLTNQTAAATRTAAGLGADTDDGEVLWRRPSGDDMTRWYGQVR